MVCASLVVFLFFGPAAALCFSLAARLVQRDEVDVSDVPRASDRYIHIDDGRGRSSVWYLPPDGQAPVCLARTERLDR